MRGLTSWLRGPTDGAVRASPAAPSRWLRGAVVATLVGAFLSFIGAFGTSDVPPVKRTLFMVGQAWVGAFLGVIAYRIAARAPFTGGVWWRAAILGGVMMAAPMGVVVWAASHLVNVEGPRLDVLPGYILASTVVSIAMSLLGVLIGNSLSGAAVPAAVALPEPPKFLARLPLKLQGAEVWAVEAEDHYLRLHTSKGQDLILLRLADAVRELEGIEGEQVHRSWWVARAAVTDAERGDGRAILTLKDGSKVPVSRTYAKVIREKGWI